ncbi:MAG: hypothetical protein AAF909_07165 [Pseudomonadota bacterium]
MEWGAYEECCYRAAAVKASAAFCGSCAKPLLRCMNYAECKQLVAPSTPCAVCLTPELIVEEGAQVGGGVGAKLAIPLKLRNHNAKINRPIYLQRLVTREGDGPPREVSLDWELVEPGRERSFRIEAGPFAASGVASIELTLTLAQRSKEGFEERYVFGGALLFTVESESNQQIVQNIDFSGAHFETGGLVKTDLRVDQADAAVADTARRRVVSLERRELSELKDGVRGYADRGLRVSSAVSFAFEGFSAQDAPGFEIGLGARGALAVGRSGRVADPERNPAPMDLSLRAYGRDGGLDREASLRLSRHHFDLLVLNDQLVVHARSGKGVSISGREVRSGALEPVADGDVITPCQDVDLGVAARFHATPHGVVERITLRRA